MLDETPSDGTQLTVCSSFFILCGHPRLLLFQAVGASVGAPRSPAVVLPDKSSTTGTSALASSHGDSVTLPPLIPAANASGGVSASPSPALPSAPGPQLDPGVAAARATSAPSGSSTVSDAAPVTTTSHPRYPLRRLTSPLLNATRTGRFLACLAPALIGATYVLAGPAVGAQTSPASATPKVPLRRASSAVSSALSVSPPFLLFPRIPSRHRARRTELLIPSELIEHHGFCWRPHCDASLRVQRCSRCVASGLVVHARRLPAAARLPNPVSNGLAPQG